MSIMCTNYSSSPEVGIIGANVEGIACSDVPNRTAVASIVAIHGMPNVCVGTYGFTVTEENVIAFINLVTLKFTFKSFLRVISWCKIAGKLVFWRRQEKAGHHGLPIAFW